MSDKIYTVDEIKAIAAPIAQNYGVAAFYLFGSYIRGEATSQSDIDFHVNRGKMIDLLDLGGLYSDLEDRFQKKKVGVLTTQMLTDKFLSGIRSKEVLLYAQPIT